MLIIYEEATGEIRQIVKSSLQSIPQDMVPRGFSGIKTNRTDINPIKEKVSVDGRIVDKEVADVEAQEIVEAWFNLRSDRMQLLAGSDWTQLPDSGCNKQAWAQYRQALRDLPQNTTDPRNPTWPQKPNE